MTGGVSASVPGRGWDPGDGLDAVGLSLEVHIEGKPRPVHVQGGAWGGPRQLTLDVLSGIRALVDAGDWASRDTLVANTAMLGHFVSWVADWDSPHVVGLRKPESVAAISDEHWRAFRREMGTGNRGRRYQQQVGKVLWASGQLNADVVPVVRSRKGQIVSGEVEHYTVAEFSAIFSAAKGVVRAAHARIASNYAEALAAANHVGPPTRGSVLYGLLANPTLTSVAAAQLVDCVAYRKGFDERRGKEYDRATVLTVQGRALLYPTVSEAFAAAVVLVCFRGENWCQVESMGVPDRSFDSSGAVARVGTDKPRRGTSRFSLEVFGDTGVDSDGAWLRRIEEMAAPLRHHGEFVGNQVESLVAYMTRTGAIASARPGSGQRTWDWLDGLPSVDLRRLKRTFETRVSKEPTQNSEAVHSIAYMGRDPLVRRERRVAAIAGVERARSWALESVQLLVSDKDDLLATDMLVTGCADPDEEPSTGLPCEDGFLGCLMCPNGVATPRHVPSMVYTLEVLEGLRGTVSPSVWKARFQRAHLQLEYLISEAPAEARSKRLSKDRKERIRFAFGFETALV